MSEDEREGALIGNRPIKKEIRILGIASSPLRGRMRRVPVIGVVYRGAIWLEGVLRCELDANGVDATTRLAEMITTSAHYPQIRVIVISSPFLAGYNTVDLTQLYKQSRLPTLAVLRNEIKVDRVLRSVERLPKYDLRRKALEELGKPIVYRPASSPERLYIYAKGLSEDSVKSVIDISCGRGRIPEPLRVAAIIAKAILKVRALSVAS